MAATPKDASKENSFPRMVYRKGTGRKVDESGRYEAEGQVVHDQEQLDDLGSDWVASPQEAATGGGKDAKDPTQPAKPPDKK